MKKLTLLIVLLVMLSLTACSFSTDKESNKETTHAENVIPLEKGVWPENEYTDGLPVPKGEVTWAVIDTEAEYCSISVEELREEDYDDFMKSIAEKGFHVIESTNERIPWQEYGSSNALMSDGEKYLSVSYTNCTLVLYITLKA